MTRPIVESPQFRSKASDALKQSLDDNVSLAEFTSKDKRGIRDNVLASLIAAACLALITAVLTLALPGKEKDEQCTPNEDATLTTPSADTAKRHRRRHKPAPRPERWTDVYDT